MPFFVKFAAGLNQWTESLFNSPTRCNTSLRYSLVSSGPSLGQLDKIANECVKDKQRKGATEGMFVISVIDYGSNGA